MTKNPIDYYVFQYPQLTLGVKNGLKNTEEYKDIVLRGIFPDKLVLPMTSSSQEELIEVDTPIGKTEVLYLPDRNIFEYFVKVLAYRCEDVQIPKTTGAIFISGLNNWRKIEEHKNDFLKDHKQDEWDDEFDRFTSDKQNYQGCVLLISKGNYSALDYKLTGFEQEEWLDISKKIRIYHEISHQISRKLYPEHKQAIRDEVLADGIGIVGALGKYDKDLHLKVLGIINNEYVKGSRLENYIDEAELDGAVTYAKDLIEKFSKVCISNELKPFELLLKIEEDYIR